MQLIHLEHLFFINKNKKKIIKKFSFFILPINPYERNLLIALNAKQVIGPSVSSERIISRNGVKNVIESIS
jgi:hypothetical protein